MIEATYSVYSLVRFENDRLGIFPGDWIGVTTDGTRNLRCLALYPSRDMAAQALNTERAVDRMLKKKKQEIGLTKA